MLRIILNKPDLVITECRIQKDMKRLAGARSICLDAYGSDPFGRKYDVEVQRGDKGADPHRARFYSSSLDIENLDAGQSFDELPETFTVFITERDFYGMGAPIYRIERINITTGKLFGDGEHIIFVNGEYRGDSDIGKLMHDFSCTNADDMYFDLMAERTRYLKENPKGVSEMCKIIEKIREEERVDAFQAGRQDRDKELVLHMLSLGESMERIAALLGRSLEEIKKLQAEALA